MQKREEEKKKRKKITKKSKNCELTFKNIFNITWLVLKPFVLKIYGRPSITSIHFWSMQGMFLQQVCANWGAKIRDLRQGSSQPWGPDAVSGIPEIRTTGYHSGKSAPVVREERHTQRWKTQDWPEYAAAATAGLLQCLHVTTVWWAGGNNMLEWG